MQFATSELVNVIKAHRFFCLLIAIFYVFSFFYFVYISKNYKKERQNIILVRI